MPVEKIDKKKLIPADLNDGQKEAYVKIRNFLSSKSPDFDMFLLEGFAGTGKTYVIGKIVKYIEDNTNWKVAVTAPTNKAVKVLKRTGGLGINKRRVSFQTIHKLLGLTEEITSDGKQKFVKKFNDESRIEDYNVVIVDEVSMLNDDLFLELVSFNSMVKIIFMGDPAQIPPVGKSDCIPFKESERVKYKIDRYLLTEIMRQSEGNPIIGAGFLMRENLLCEHSLVPKADNLMPNGTGIVNLDFNEKNVREGLSDLFAQYFDCQFFRADPDYAKIIAWRNVTVNKLNNIVRSIIYKDKELSRIMTGEKLVANKPIIDKFGVIVFNTNDEFEAVNYKVSFRTCATESKSVRLGYYDTKVKYTDIDGSVLFKRIDILHEDSFGDFNRVLEELKKEALSKRGFDAKKAWVRYYEFMRGFADVGYNYSITGHRSQGSTYNNVFVIEDDIRQNRNTFEMNRILYTVYTRPSEKLFLIRR